MFEALLAGGDFIRRQAWLCGDFRNCYVEKSHTMHFQAPFPNGESGPESDDDSEGGEEDAGEE